MNTDAFADDCFELVFIDDVEAKNPRASHLIANFNGALRAARLVNGRSESWKAWQSVETTREDSEVQDFQLPLTLPRYPPSKMRVLLLHNQHPHIHTRQVVKL